MSQYKWVVFYILMIPSLGSVEVKMIFAIIRHADRNPVSGIIVDLCYPNDPHKNVDWKPDGAVQLTSTGKRNAYKLGKFFRERYDDLFGSTYKNNIVYFHSVQMPRSINTAQLIAAGLFPPDESQIWNSNLRWTPVPVHITPMLEDTEFFPFALCENYQRDRKKVDKELNGILTSLTDVREFFNYLTVHTGANHTTTVKSWLLYHQLAAQASVGAKLEPWTQDIFPNGKLKDMTAIEYILQTYTPRMKRLMGGIWIKKFLDSTEDIVANKKIPKGFFYTGNEVQIAGVLNALGVYTAHVPDYSSAVVFELHKVAEKYYVKVIYKEQEVPLEFIIPGCKSTLCSLPTFRRILRKSILQNFEQDCGNRTEFSLFG